MITQKPIELPIRLRLGAAAARLLLWAVLAAWFVFAVLWGTLQVWIVPRIGEYRVQIEQRASQALGVPIRIGAISAHSDGMVPSLELRDVRLMDPQGREALHLPLVLASLTPRSLWHASFEQITLQQPVLEIRRLADGRIEMAGLDLARSASAEGHALDWFFSQRGLVISGGTLRWSDAMRPQGGPMGDAPLVLAPLDLEVRNTGRNHVLRLDATPPPDLGARFTLQGQFTQPFLSAHPGAWREWSGQWFANGSRVDLARLQALLGLGQRIHAGQGALRAWVDVAAGQVQGLTADVALSQFNAQLGPGLQALDLTRLTGRLAARRMPGLGGGLELSADQLRFATPDGIQWHSGKLLLARSPAQGSSPASGSLQAEHVDLAALTRLADRLPLDDTAHTMLASYAAKGMLDALQLHWQGAGGTWGPFDAKGRVTQLELAAQRSTGTVGTGTVQHEAPGRPGLRGATIDFALTQAGGSAKVGISKGALEFPGIFEDPVLPVDELKASVQWKQAGNRIDVSVPSLQLANADLQGQAQATWHTADAAPGAASGRFPGVLDLQGSLLRVNGSKVYRYLPTVIPAITRDYLRDAILAGTASDVTLRIQGDLHDMPFSDPQRGEFLVSGKVSNAALAYVPRKAAREGMRFPPLHQLSGELVIERNTLEVRNATGRIVGAPGLLISHAQARIADLMHSSTVAVSADVKGPLADMLGVVNNSDLAGLTGQALAGTTASGNAELRLQLALPVLAIERSKVQGSVTLASNDVQLSPLLPLLSRSRGVVAFDETGLRTASVQARFLGGDIRIETAGKPAGIGAAGAATPPGPTVLRVQGVATAEGLRQAQEVGTLARLAQSASGSASYTALVTLRRGMPEITFTSSLQGLALNLPVPFAKSAESALPLRFENTLLHEPAASGGGWQDQVVLDVGKLLSVTYQRERGSAAPRVLRGAIAAGLAPGEFAPLPDSGVVANIRLDQIDVDAWDALLSHALGSSPVQPQPEGSASSAGSEWRAYLPTSIAVRARQMVLGGHRLSNLVVGGTREGRVWRANVDASELSGYVEYRQPSGAGAGRLYARLAHMDISPTAQTDIETTLQGQPAHVPALDIVVEDLELRGKHLGRVEMDAVNRGAQAVARDGGVREWRLNHLNITMPEGTLTATGNWAALGAEAPAGTAARGVERRRIVMNFRLDVGDAGEMLKRLGQPGVIRRGKGRLQGQVSWLGSPLALDYPSLSGQLHIDVETGQFLKADPGIAKLLGVLSLQSLPRRLALDFRDVFSEGFAFDFIRGDARIEQGIAYTNNLQMKGVNAAVLMEGSADIARETQDLKVVVVPEINAGTASLVATIINPAVGLGTFLAQLFLRRPLIQANTQELHIDGTWAHPRTTPIERKPVPQGGPQAVPPVAP